MTEEYAASPEGAKRLAQEYFHACRLRFPALRALVFRNPLEDFVPGISDIDMRLICQDVQPCDWRRLDEAVFHVHSSLVSGHPSLWRLLEHPPGACITVSEALDPKLFLPEMRQWEWCSGDEDLRRRLYQHISSADWSQRDELHWLSRLLSYYRPWGEVESRINLGPGLEARFRVHGIVMLHFLPALQAALSLMTRMSVPGKLAALRGWADLRPGNALLLEVAELLDRGYEEPALYDEPGLVAFRDRCRAFLDEIQPQVLASVSLVSPATGEGIEHLWHRVSRLQSDNLVILFDAVRFSRIRRAHFRCFLQAPSGFETSFFIVNEINTLRDVIAEPALGAYAAIKWGMENAGADHVLSQLRESVADSRGKEAAREILEITTRNLEEEPAARALLRRACEIYPEFHVLLEALLDDIMDRTAVLG